ncbi:hypothetical protein KVT40_003987 [Elsinoe batatas]|uniref:Uncharacterized protein n=1 Tax=Elsinoe batatas TaxID=2601811 RepID=A0A8K0L1U6_9PEZI|nr:hypothetical protein KVT40_003987 [Elsinoe batatas]
MEKLTCRSSRSTLPARGATGLRGWKTPCIRLLFSVDICIFPIRFSPCCPSQLETMRFFTQLVAVVGLASVCTAAAVDTGVARLQKRNKATEALAVVQDLFDQIRVVTANINATRAGLNADSTIFENATALVSFQTDITSITTLVTAATVQVNAISVLPAKRSFMGLFVRQEPPSTTVIDLSNLLVTLLLEVENTVNPLLTNLGLGPLVDAVLVPLEQAINALVGALGELVDGLIALVVQLLDAITSAVGAIIGPILGALLGFLGIGTPPARTLIASTT